MIQTVTQRHTRRWPLFLAAGLLAGFLLLCLLSAVIVALAVLYGRGGLPGGVGLPGATTPDEETAKQFILSKESYPGAVRWTQFGPDLPGVVRVRYRAATPNGATQDKDVLVIFNDDGSQVMLPNYRGDNWRQAWENHEPGGVP